MFSLAVATIDHFPSIAQLTAMATELGFKAKSGWTYKVSTCANCGGVGWFYGRRPRGDEAIYICEQCDAGRNLLAGPKGTLKATLKREPGSSWLRVGR